MKFAFYVDLALSGIAQYLEKYCTSTAQNRGNYLEQQCAVCTIVHEALPSQLKYVGDFNALKAKHRKKNSPRSRV